MNKLKDLINKAKNSLCLEESINLAHNNNMLVRRALARATTHQKVLDILAFDSVLNVSFMALNNPNCRVNRDIDKDSIRPCVSCHTDELQIDCIKCGDMLHYNKSH